MNASFKYNLSSTKCGRTHKMIQKPLVSILKADNMRETKHDSRWESSRNEGVFNSDWELDRIFKLKEKEWRDLDNYGAKIYW